MLQRRERRNNPFDLFDTFARESVLFDDDDDFFGSSLLRTGNRDPFADMEAMMNSVSNGDGFCSSSYSSYSYSSSGPGSQPVVIQKSITERRNGRDMTERHETYSNSAEGIEKATVGRRIGDRARIIEKNRKMGSGEENTLDTLHNLDETTAADFDREWQSRSSSMGRLSYAQESTAPSRRLLTNNAAERMHSEAKGSKPKRSKEKETSNLRRSKF